MNRSAATTRLLEHLLTIDGHRPFYGHEIITATGLSSGTVYPGLQRLVAMGWVKAETLEIRSRPRLHRWAPGGRAEAEALLNKPRRRELAA